MYDQESAGDKRTQVFMQELTAACKQNSNCLKKTPFEKVACIRSCVSPHCYRLVYGKDPLEPGEIDVKYNDYKICFHHTLKDKHPLAYNDLLMQ